MGSSSTRGPHSIGTSWKAGARQTVTLVRCVGYVTKYIFRQKGKFIHIDGDIYDGEWKDDKYKGRGILYNPKFDAKS